MLGVWFVVKCQEGTLSHVHPGELKLWQSKVVRCILGHTQSPPVKLLLPDSTPREMVMPVDGDFPFTHPFITGEGPVRTGNRQKERTVPDQ